MAGNLPLVFAATLLSTILFADIAYEEWGPVAVWPTRIFAVFDEAAGQWAWPPGEFTVQVGRSSRDLRLSATVRSG